MDGLPMLLTGLGLQAIHVVEQAGIAVVGALPWWVWPAVISAVMARVVGHMTTGAAAHAGRSDRASRGAGRPRRRRGRRPTRRR